MAEETNKTNKTTNTETTKNETKQETNPMEIVINASEKAEKMDPYWLNTSLLKYIIISDTSNTKEEYEVLNGLFIGNYMFEERKSLEDVKLSKIIDLL